MSNQRYSIWWGPPRKFSVHVAERKISWLELFYDLVYAIVISKVTRYLVGHPDGAGLLDYAFLFAMTFWGWYNGSLHHDLHGSPGIRTRFMTLWQMVIAGALAVTLDSPPSCVIYRTTIALLFLQFFITYLWWSVGIYDKTHRRSNMPYTICFLSAFALLLVTFFVPLPYKRIVFWAALLFNYLPFALMATWFTRSGLNFQVSASMAERLGGFTIIVFGEAILGVINSVSGLPFLNAAVWLCFVLAMIIVFALWWIFFAIIADRESKKNTLAGSLMSSIYIPTLASLGMVGVAFPAVLKNLAGREGFAENPLQAIYGVSIALFLLCVAAISHFLVYPAPYEKSRSRLQALVCITGGVNLLLTVLFSFLPVFVYLLCVFISLVAVIVVITRIWYRVEASQINRDSMK